MKGGLQTKQLFSLWRLLLVGMLSSHSFKTMVTSVYPDIVVGGYCET